MKHAHFGGLNGLRGVAALAVLLFHIGAESHLGIVPHGYLAVDFFFLLSGFVIACAYEDDLRSGRLTAPAYLRIRLVRLYPTIFIGLVLGLALHVLAERTIMPSWALAFVFIPVIHTVQAYPLDNPVWSLALELVANAFHATVARRLSNALLAILILLSALALGLVSHATGGINVGWAMPADQPVALWFAGLPRVFFSFFSGVALFRLHRAGRLRSPACPWPLTAMLLATVLAVPMPYPAVSDLLCVGLVFPLLIGAGISSEPANGVGRMAAWLGAISYPLYALHFPLVERIARFQHNHVPTGIGVLVCYAAGAIFIVGLADALARYREGRRAGMRQRFPAAITTQALALRAGSRAAPG